MGECFGHALSVTGETGSPTAFSMPVMPHIPSDHSAKPIALQGLAQSEPYSLTDRRGGNLNLPAVHDGTSDRID